MVITTDLTLQRYFYFTVLDVQVNKLSDKKSQGLVAIASEEKRDDDRWWRFFKSDFG